MHSEYLVFVLQIGTLTYNIANIMISLHKNYVICKPWCNQKDQNWREFAMFFTLQYWPF